MSQKEEKQIVCWPSPGCKMYCGLCATVEDGKLVGLAPNMKYPSANTGCGDRLPHFIKWLDTYSVKENIEFVVCTSGDPEFANEAIKPYILK